MTNDTALESFTDTVVLATSWLNQPALGDRPARTLLAGASTLAISLRFGRLSFHLQAHSSTVTDDPADTMRWLVERLPAGGQLLLWRAEDIVVPSMIAAADTARDQMTAARLLRALERAFTGEVVDVAEPHGGARAKSFDAIAHRHGMPFIPMTREQLGEAHRTGCHGAIREHLAGRVKAMWRLWLADQLAAEGLQLMTEQWLDGAQAELKR